MTKEVLKYWKHSWKEVLYLSLRTHIHAQLLISVDRDQAARPFEALHSFIEIWRLTELDYVTPWTKNSGKLFCLSKPKVLKSFQNSRDMYSITGKIVFRSLLLSSIVSQIERLQSLHRHLVICNWEQPFTHPFFYSFSFKTFFWMAI